MSIGWGGFEFWPIAVVRICPVEDETDIPAEVLPEFFKIKRHFTGDSSPKKRNSLDIFLGLEAILIEQSFGQPERFLWNMIF